MRDPTHPRDELPPGRPRRVWVWRCPACGSTAAGPDESRSVVDMTWMQCRACGEGGLCDSWERDHDWQLEIELPAGSSGYPAFVPPVPSGKRWHDPEPAAPPSTADAGGGSFGCARCSGADADVAWSAGLTRRLQTLVDESHHDIAVTACDCGQRFVLVFTERVDWVGGEDDQTWMLLAVSGDEAAQLQDCPAAGLHGLLHRIGVGRRFLLRTFPTGGALSVQWRDQGFWIGPHD